MKCDIIKVERINETAKVTVQTDDKEPVVITIILTTDDLNARISKEVDLELLRRKNLKTLEAMKQ